MYKYIIEKAGESEWMALIPLLLFFIIFISITIIALTRKKEYLDKMSRLPLEDDELNELTV